MNAKKDIAVIIATHKKYQMPSDEMYFPVHVGCEGKETIGYTGDNTGDNISLKNLNYCELTGLYWAWKNLEAGYLGLAHYRRHFSNGKKNKDVFENVIGYNDIKSDLGKIKIFVPKKRKYYIESLYSHYAHTHYAEHLDNTRKIISEIYPEYLESYDDVVKRTYGYMFNMMIMTKELFNDYCQWLFDILFKLEAVSDSLELSGFQNRFYGRVSEIIFNVWLDYQIKTNKINENEIKELPFIYMEKIAYRRKVKSFVMAKVFHKKYEGSF